MHKLEEDNIRSIVRSIGPRSSPEIIRNLSQDLEHHYGDQMILQSEWDRSQVSFQANKHLPLYRWFKYKEGFSAELITHLLADADPTTRVLDPFAGSGTTLFIANQLGLQSVGIEVLPLGWTLIEARQKLQQKVIDQGIELTLHQLRQGAKAYHQEHRRLPFPHLRITEAAFPVETEIAIEQYLATISRQEDPVDRILLTLPLLCILEDISYTRKDGQYLRWDHRSGRSLSRNPFVKPLIKSFGQALQEKLDQICDDLAIWAHAHQDRGSMESTDLTLLKGSCLNLLPQLEDQSFDLVITSPPYCNRYDYTRTYALELALLGVSEAEIRKLRQDLLACTVEHHAKSDLEATLDPTILNKATIAFHSQHCLHAILNYLDDQRQAKLLNNPGIVRMIQNYFWEMTLVIFQLAPLIKPGGLMIMINDNVRYQGIPIPVDLILSELAIQAGFTVEAIWILPISKGNSSQQMGVHGRDPLRKGIYRWRRQS